MKNREQLHLFIKKLDKSEKRAFKLYMSKYETTKNKKLVKLFDVINKMKVFDESKLDKRFPSKTLNADLHHLSQRLLNSLSDLYFKKGGHGLGEIINRIELGFKYEMPEMIEEELVKGYKLAEEENNNAIYTLIAKYENDFSLLQKDLNRLIGTDETILAYNALLQKDTLYDLMLKEVFSWYKKNASKETVERLVFSRPELEEIFNGSIEDKANYIQSKAFYAAKSMYSNMYSDYETQLKVDEAIFYLQVKSDIDSKRNPAFCYNFSNLVLAYLRNEKLVEAKKVLSVFKEKYIDPNEFSNSNIIELVYYKNQVLLLFFEQNYKEIIFLKSHYEKYFDPKANESFIHLDYNLLREFSVLVMLSYFHLKDYEKCINYITNNDGNFGPGSAINVPIDLRTKFAETLCYQELGSEEMVNDLLNEIGALIDKRVDEKSVNVYYYGILQAIIKEKSIPQNWNNRNPNHYESVLGINGVLEQYLTN